MNQINRIEKSISVSFIIPALNVEVYLPRCLDAIKREIENVDFSEVIVVDNGSADKTTLIAKEYGAVVYILPCKTVAALRNEGARQAKGSLLAFVDADCVVQNGWLENALKHFHNPEVGAVGAATIIEDAGTWVSRYWFLQRKTGESVSHVKWLATENLIMRKDVFEKAGGFNEKLVTCEDVDLGYRISNSYLIISDSNIKSIHLGEAKTIKGFYKKERWRGKGNIMGMFSHGIVRDEVPSLMLPLYYLIAFLMLPFSVLLSLIDISLMPAIVSVALIILPPLLLSFRTAIRHSSLKTITPLFVLYLTYALARTVAILPERKRIKI